MSSEKTPNLQLHKWQATDYVQRTEFNDNFAKIDEHANQVTQQLAHVALNPKSFEAKEDGTTDDTDALQSMFDYAKQNSLRSVKLNRKPYRLKRIIDVPSNVEINLNGAQLLFENTDNLIINDQTNRHSWFGIFNVHGTPTGSKVNITSYDSAQNKYGYNALLLNKKRTFLGRWGVGDASQFSKGDFVIISIPFRENSLTNIVPMAEVLARVEYIEGNYIYTDYYSPYDWSNYSFVAGEDTIQKCIPKENIVIKNGVIKDTSNKTNRSGSDGPDRAYNPCGIGIAYASNVKVENVVFDNLKFSGVTQYFTHSCHTENIDMRNPAYTGPGEGYATQNMNVMNLLVERVRSTGVPRHLVDISSGYFCKVRDCNGGATTNAAFDLHGEGDHDIEFDNVVGGISFGNGLAYFPENGKNVSIRHSKIALIGLGYYENTIISDSDVFIYTYDRTQGGGTNSVIYSPQITFKNCDIKLSQSPKIQCAKRGQDVYAELVLDTCKISYHEGETLTVNDAFEISGYDRVTVKDCVLRDMQGWGFMLLRNNKVVNIKGNDVKDSLIFADAPNLAGDLSYSYTDNEFVFTDFYTDKLQTVYNDVLQMTNFPNCEGILFVRGNLFYSKQTNSSSKLYVMDLWSSANAGANIDVIMSDNAFKTKNANSLGFKFMLDNTTTKITSSNNVVQGTISDESGSASIYSEYKKSAIVLSDSDLRIEYSGTTTACYAKIASVPFTATGHKQLVFDYISNAGVATSAGRVVASIRVDTMGNSATNVNVKNTVNGISTTVDGDDFIIVESTLSASKHVYDVYVALPAYNTLKVRKLFDLGVFAMSKGGSDTVTTLPTGAQYRGSNIA